MIRQTKGEKIFNIINIIILCALVVIMVLITIGSILLPCLRMYFMSVPIFSLRSLYSFLVWK